MYKSDQQWITIVNTSNNEDSFSKSDPISSLINTFTSTIDNSYQSNLEKDTYKVNGEVGTLIASKLAKGEKLRVCRNGEPIGLNISSENDDYFMMGSRKR